MNKFFQNAKRGFTLVELLIVIIIIAVLAGIVLVTINPAEQRYKARLASMKNNVASACGAQAVCLVDKDPAACDTFATTEVDVTNPYAAATSVSAAGVVVCPVNGTDCMGIGTAAPYYVGALANIDTTDFTFACHNTAATANKGLVTCTATVAAPARTCVQYNVN